MVHFNVSSIKVKATSKRLHFWCVWLDLYTSFNILWCDELVTLMIFFSEVLHKVLYFIYNLRLLSLKRQIIGIMWNCNHLLNIQQNMLCTEWSLIVLSSVQWFTLFTRWIINGHVIYFLLLTSVKPTGHVLQCNFKCESLPMLLHCCCCRAASK